MPQPNPIKFMIQNRLRGRYSVLSQSDPREMALDRKSDLNRWRVSVRLNGALRPCFCALTAGVQQKRCDPLGKVSRCGEEPMLDRKIIRFP
jgi:hypothetical protein